ncbi:MAG: hypothetical protein Q9190_000335 [Brigantiaea leucoxantha]
MSRHNRRRTRERSYKNIIPSFRHPTNDPNATAADRLGLYNSSNPSLPLPATGRKNDLSARHWHNRYVAWQNRERRQAEERKKLAAERQRIFGGDSDEGDEDGLCSNMMRYFVALDFIEE